METTCGLKVKHNVVIIVRWSPFAHVGKELCVSPWMLQDSSGILAKYEQHPFFLHQPKTLLLLLARGLLLSIEKKITTQ